MMNKTCLVWLILGLCMPIESQTQSLTGQFQSVFNLETGLNYNANALYRHQFDNNWLVYSFALVSPTWGECRFGVGYGQDTRIGYVEGGASIGIETFKDFPLRGDAYLFWSSRNKKWKGLLDIERGGSGWWHLYYTQVEVLPSLALGVRSQRFLVTGGMVVWTIPKSPLTLWVAAGVDPFMDDSPRAGAFGLQVKI